MNAARSLFILLLASASAFGQEAGSSARRVGGTVYDSVGRRPLAGAVVEIVMVAPERKDATLSQANLPSFATLTDSAGHFEVSGLRAGLYAVGFEHHVLNALGIESPITPLDLRVDSAALLNLAVPGGQTVRDSVCAGRTDDGLLAGYITEARGGAPLDRVSIIVGWDELDLGDRLSTSHHQSSARTNGAGRFSLCGLPRDAPLGLRISSAGYRAIDTEIELPADGVVHQDFRLPSLADSARGSSMIRLRVVDDSGAVMMNGRAMIVSIGRRVSIDSGMATLGGLPSGTWAVDVRAIGFQPAIVMLDAESAPPTTTIRMDRLPQLLEPVSIVERARAAERAILDGIDQRMRAGGGTLITADNPSLRNATWASDGLRFARGFRTRGSEVQGRPYTKGFAPQPCRSVDFPGIGEKSLAVYLDGVRVPFGLQGVNDLVRPEEILAIEAYPDVLSAPGIWQTSDACAVVGFWTKR
jgi:hypothetical protein